MPVSTKNTGKSEPIVNKFFRFIKYNFKAVLIVIFILGMLVFASLGNKGLISRFRMEGEKKKLEEQIKAENQKTKDLQKEIDDLKTSDKKIEQVAREKYGMTKENEKIYKIKVDSTK
ncbi:hypothetical protein BH10BAC5_BH10BAC5_11980 [soil metagenome]